MVRYCKESFLKMPFETHSNDRSIRVLLANSGHGWVEGKVNFPSQNALLFPSPSPSLLTHILLELRTSFRHWHKAHWKNITHSSDVKNYTGKKKWVEMRIQRTDVTNGKVIHDIIVRKWKFSECMICASDLHSRARYFL